MRKPRPRDRVNLREVAQRVLGRSAEPEAELDGVIVAIAAASLCVPVLVSEATGEIEGRLLWGSLWPEHLRQLLKRNASSLSAFSLCVSLCASVSVSVCLSLSHTQTFLGLNSKKAMTALYKRITLFFSDCGETCWVLCSFARWDVAMKE